MKTQWTSRVVTDTGAIILSVKDYYDIDVVEAEHQC